MNGSATFKWVMGDRLSHCPVCSQYAGQIKTLAEWSLVATPPLHGHCGCALQMNDWTELPEPPGPPVEQTPRPALPPGINGEIPYSKPTPWVAVPNPPPGTPRRYIPWEME